MGRKVLIPFDRSDHSMKAFDFYLENLYKEEDNILFVHVVHASHSQPVGEEIDAENVKEKLIKTMEDAKTTYQRFEDKCTTKNIPHEKIFHSGNAGAVICDVAKEKHADLIVMGSRGLNAIRRTFLGSVSEYVLHHIHIPTTVVPSNKH
eukprot:gene16228-7602_t